MTLSLLLLSAFLGNAWADQPEMEVRARAVLDDLVMSRGVADGWQAEPRLVAPWAGGTRVRARQSVLGIPIVGRELIVSFDPDGTPTRVDGRMVPEVRLDPTPIVSSAEAVRLATEAVRAQGHGSLAWEPRHALRVWFDPGEQPHLVWQIDVGAGAPFTTWRAFVDAHDGKLLALGETLVQARGNVYPTNPVVSEVTEVELFVTQNQLQGPYATAWSCDTWSSQSGCTAKSRHAVADEDGNFLFPPDPGSLDDPFAEVQMYYHLDRIGAFYADRFGLDMPQMEGLVNFDYANAFYGDADGDGIGEVAFGQTGDMDFAYDADVVYHEYTHAVFGEVVDPGFFSSDEYGLVRATAGLNEGTADLFAIALTGDPLMGEYSGSAFAPFDEPIRDLRKVRRCPDAVYGESHIDGEIWGSFGWRMMDDERIGVDVVTELVYAAMLTWPSDMTWPIAGESIATTADEMLDAELIDETTHAAIYEIGQRTGVIGCGRVVRLDEGATPTQVIRHMRFLGEGEGLPLENQFSLDVPLFAHAVEFRVTEFTSGHPNFGWNVYVRRGTHIVHELVDIETNFGTMQLPAPADYDYVIEGSGQEGVIRLTPDSLDAPLAPGATYFFSITSRADGEINGYASADITVEGEVLFNFAEEGVACGCGAPAGVPASLVWLVPLAWVAGRRRKEP
ncbi:MAG: hypothetical protein JRI25_05970 [Deltaproteobacteria bacterium]|nr:hypothetical protein [Deltaproteobacteria bacterium]